MPSSSLLRSARPLVLGRALSALVTFLLPVVLARVLDRSAYGTYKQVYLVANLALYSLQFGLAQSLYYFLPRTGDERERRAIMWQTQLLLAAVGGGVAVALAFGAPLLAQRFSNPELAGLGAPTGLLAGALVASAPLEVALTARGRPGWSAVALVSTDIVRTAGMLVPVLLGYGVEGLAWGAAGAALLRWLASLQVAGICWPLLPARGRLARQIAYAVPFGLAMLLAIPQQQMHQLLVAARAAPAEFALYAVGCMQIPVVSLLYTPVSEVLQVRLAALERTGETHRAGEVFAEAVERLALAFLPLCALLVALAGPAILLLYGAQYAGSASVMRIAVASVAVASLPVDGVLKARARTGTLLATYALKLAATWPVLALGYRLFGMEGAILGHVAVDGLTRALLLLVIARELRVPVRTLVGGARLARSLAVAAVTGAAAWAASLPFDRPLLACAAGGAAGAAVVLLEMLHRRRAARRPSALVRAA